MPPAGAHGSNERGPPVRNSKMTRKDRTPLDPVAAFQVQRSHAIRLSQWHPLDRCRATPPCVDGMVREGLYD